MDYLLKLFVLFSFLLTLVSCKTNQKLAHRTYTTIAVSQEAPVSAAPITQEITQGEVIINNLIEDPNFSNHFAGLVVYDPQKRKKLIDYNGDRYFTPASNIKIFTFYTLLKILNDPLVLFEYNEQADGLYLKGTANPAFLHPYLKPDLATIHFLKKPNKNIFISTGIFDDGIYGPGWAWDDASEIYQTEKSAFPIYGNIATIYKVENRWRIDPSILNKYLVHSKESLKRPKRDPFSNRIEINNNTITTKYHSFDIPICFQKESVRIFLSDTLERKVVFGETANEYTDYSITILDTLLYKMMHESDNSIAEQLLLHAAYELCDTMSSQKIIEHSLSNYLNELTDNPRWIDGSGLSRYNLATPFSMVQVLEKIRRRLPKSRIHYFFPKIPIDVELAENTVIAKSGSLSNNYNLSGYMTCKSGREVIFSFFNNHYLIPRHLLIENMKKILLEVYHSY